MNELSDIFGGHLTTEIFWYSTIAFVLFYAAGFVFLQQWSRSSGRTSATRRHVISGVSAAFGAMAVALGLHAANITMAFARGQPAAASSMLPHELHRSSATKSLPVQKIDDQTFVFPNQD